MDSGFAPEPVIGRRFAPTRWARPGMTESFSPVVTPRARSPEPTIRNDRLTGRAPPRRPHVQS